MMSRRGLLLPGYDKPMETYLPTLTVAGVLAFLAPLLSTAVYKLTASPKVKQIVTIAVAAVLAVIALLVTNGFTLPTDGQSPVIYWLLILFQVIAVAQIAYTLVWKRSAINDKVALVTSSESERQKYINENTIQGEVIPEDKEGVPDVISEATPPVVNGDTPFTK